jgi:2-phosphoglycerate kinase
VTAARPPILLVGGAPGAGKTTLARALAARLGATAQTFDHIVAGIRSVTTTETHPAFHAGRSGHLEYFTDTRPDRLIEDALELEAACWPAIERICALSRSSAVGLIMDWWLLSPRQLATASLPGVVGVWIEIDPEALERREHSNEAFFSASTDPVRMFANFMARSTWANDHYPSQARAFGFPVIQQPGDRPTADLVDAVVGGLTDRGFAL